MTLLRATEIKCDVELCLSNGELNPDATGWSRYPRHVCNLRGHWLRKKRWNYWCVTDGRFVFSLTLASLDYAGIVAAYYIDLGSGEMREAALTLPLSIGLRFAPRVESDIAYTSRNVTASIAYTSDAILLQLNWKQFGSAPLSADIRIQRNKRHQSLNVVVPWSLRRFQFTSKQHCLPASGIVRHGEREWRFSEGDSCATLDFGRGIWPRRTEWNWAAFWTRTPQGLLGFNAGAKWTDNTGSNENGIILDSKLFKLHEPVSFIYDDTDFMKPWRLRTEFSDSVELRFEPVFERTARTNLGVVKSEVHQMFGHFSGAVQAGDDTIEIECAPGWAEEHKAVW